jgi:hypothetical protein
MPKLAVIPNALIRDLCHGGMTLANWVELAAPLRVDGLEDGVDGMKQLTESVRYLRQMMAAHFPAIRSRDAQHSAPDTGPDARPFPV